MLTNDKKITTADYWNEVYSGKRNDTKTDASNFKRPANAFDRFQWVADLVEGPNVLGVASGHARIERLVISAHPDWLVVASDQAIEAKKVANYEPYIFADAYDLPGRWDTIICTQALEYMDDIPRFLKGAQKVARKLIVSAPLGEMKLWSQLYVFTPKGLKSILMPFGEIEIEDVKEDIMLFKLKFND